MTCEKVSVQIQVYSYKRGDGYSDGLVSDILSM